MYAALADVVRDPERRLWHRAAAAVGHDEEVASALDEHAQIARRRGAVMVAAGALERAATLTAEPRPEGRAAREGGGARVRPRERRRRQPAAGGGGVTPGWPGRCRPRGVVATDDQRCRLVREGRRQDVRDDRGAATRRRRCRRRIAVARADRASLLVDAVPRPDAAVHRRRRRRHGLSGRRPATPGGHRTGGSGSDGPIGAAPGGPPPAPGNQRSSRGDVPGHRLRESGRLRRRVSLSGARRRAAARAGQARPAHAGARPLRVGCHLRGRLGSRRAGCCRRRDSGARHSPAAVRTHRTARGSTRHRAARQRNQPRCPPNRAGANTDGDQRRSAARSCTPCPGRSRSERGTARRRIPRALAGVQRKRPRVSPIHALAGRARPGRSRRPRSARRTHQAGHGRARGDRKSQRAPDPVRRSGLRTTAAERRRPRRSALRSRAQRELGELPVPARSNAVLVRSLAAPAAKNAQTRVHPYATQSTCSTPWGRRVGASAHARNCELPARGSGPAPPTLAIGSRPRNCRSPSWRQPACRIARSARGCSYPTARSDRTSIGSSRSWRSPPGRNCVRSLGRGVARNGIPEQKRRSRCLKFTSTWPPAEPMNRRRE